MEVWFHNLQTVVTPIAVCIIKGCQILNKKSKSTRAVRTLFDQIDFSSAQKQPKLLPPDTFSGLKSQNIPKMRLWPRLCLNPLGELIVSDPQTP